MQLSSCSSVGGRSQSECASERGGSFTLDASHGCTSESDGTPTRRATSPLHLAATQRLHLIEPDPSSFASDYSELGEPIREHLAGVHIIGRDDLQLANTVPPSSDDQDEDDQRQCEGSSVPPGFTDRRHLRRLDDETDEQFARRVRKTNYLSLAQEFAELKRLNADALPFDLHRDQFQTTTTTATTTTSTPTTTTTSPGLSTDDDYECDDDDDDDRVDSTEDAEGHPDSSADAASLLQAPPHSDVIPDLIPPNPCAGADDLTTHADALDNRPSSNAPLPNGRLEDLRRSSLHDAQTDVQKSCSDESSARRSTVDQSSTTNITSQPQNDRQARRTVADDTTTTTTTLASTTTTTATTTTGAAGGDEFDVYTIETALPHVEWERIEQSLRASAAAAAGEQNKRWSRCSDRDEIRRRLAMSADDDFYCSSSLHGGGGSAEFEFALQRHYHHAGRSSTSQSSYHLVTGGALHGRSMHGSTSLQVCYVNDVAADLDRDTLPAAAATAACAASQRPHPKPDVIPKSISEASTLSSVHCKISGESSAHEDFFTKQARLQAEAKLALAQVRPMARMQLQIEKGMRKKTSSLSENVVGIPGFVDGKIRQLSRQLLQRMNIAQLQVVVNDLHTQIEALNSDLMQQLVDRDDLHMAQDSMLVDIDDLTRRAQEFAAKINKRNSTAADAGCR